MLVFTDDGFLIKVNPIVTEPFDHDVALLVEIEVLFLLITGVLKLVQFNYLVALLDFDHLEDMELLFVIFAHHIGSLVLKSLF